jgi:autotransporter passenger strand-loop-strand repeat protein
VVNRGTILATGETAIGFDDNAVITGGVVNTGTIRAVQTGIVAITVSTFAGGITNNGTLSAGAVGIRLGTATNPQQYTVSSFTGDIVNSGTITAKTGITLIDSTIMGSIVDSGNLLATNHGILIDSASRLSNASRAGVLVAASKLLGGISNAGSISAITGIDVSRAATFTGGISNAGTIFAGSAGIELRNIPHFSGGISNTGAISGGTGIALIGVQSASVFDAGTIVGTGGTAIEFSGSGNTLTLGAGYVISGDVDASGSDAFQLGGSGSDTFDLDSIGTQYNGFTSFSVVGGHWNVSGSGGGWVISSGTFEVTSGTVVSNTTVKSGGTEIVDSGGSGLRQPSAMAALRSRSPAAPAAPAFSPAAPWSSSAAAPIILSAPRSAPAPPWKWAQVSRFPAASPPALP